MRDGQDRPLRCSFHQRRVSARGRPTTPQFDFNPRLKLYSYRKQCYVSSCGAQNRWSFLFVANDFDRYAFPPQNSANRFFVSLKKLIASLWLQSPKKLRFLGSPFSPFIRHWRRSCSLPPPYFAMQNRDDSFTPNNISIQSARSAPKLATCHSQLAI